MFRRPKIPLLSLTAAPVQYLFEVKLSLNHNKHYIGGCYTIQRNASLSTFSCPKTLNGENWYFSHFANFCLPFLAGKVNQTSSAAGVMQNVDVSVLLDAFITSLG